MRDRHGATGDQDVNRTWSKAVEKLVGELAPGLTEDEASALSRGILSLMDCLVEEFSEQVGYVLEDLS